MGKIRWVDDVFEAIRRLGGSATLHSIYKEVEMIRQNAGRSVPKSLEATLPAVLRSDQQGNSDGGEDEEIPKRTYGRYLG